MAMSTSDTLQSNATCIQLEHLAHMMTDVALDMDQSTREIREMAVRLREARAVVYELMGEIKDAMAVGGSDDA